jgi:hypothetical protein
MVHSPVGLDSHGHPNGKGQETNLNGKVYPLLNVRFPIANARARMEDCDMKLLPTATFACARATPRAGESVAATLLVAGLLLTSTMRAQESQPAASPERGFQQVTPQKTLAPGRRIVVAIGIDQYANWPKLKTAVSDAREFSSLLVDRFGFKEIEPPMFDAAATRENINSLFEDRLRKKLKSDDDVVIFFAGHGTTRTDEVGGEKVDTGYLVPALAGAPGTDERWGDYVKTNELLESIGRLPARHILVILDACHSGFALGGAVQSFRGADRYEADLASHVSRRVITSAGKDQLASDSGPVANHSLFTGLLLQGLEWGKADTYGDGVVTSSGLGLYIQRAVGAASDSQQTPDFGSFFRDDRGELVLPLNDQTYAGIKAQAFSALRWADLDSFRALVAKVMELRPEAAETLYLRYRAALLDGHIDDAAALVSQMIAASIPDGQIPLSQQDLWDLKARLPYWKPVLLLPETGFPLKMGLEQETATSAFEAVQPVKIGDIRAYPVKPHSAFRWQVTNVTKTPMFLYALAVDQDGRIYPFSAWDPGQILVQGLGPGATNPTAKFLQDGELERQEFHFVASPRAIYAMLSPLSSASRGISRIDLEDLRDATQVVEMYTTMDVAGHAGSGKK